MSILALCLSHSVAEAKDQYKPIELTCPKTSDGTLELLSRGPNKAYERLVVKFISGKPKKLELYIRSNDSAWLQIDDVEPFLKTLERKVFEGAGRACNGSPEVRAQVEREIKANRATFGLH